MMSTLHHLFTSCRPFSTWSSPPPSCASYWPSYWPGTYPCPWGCCWPGRPTTWSSPPPSCADYWPQPTHSFTDDTTWPNDTSMQLKQLLSWVPVRSMWCYSKSFQFQPAARVTTSHSYQKAASAAQLSYKYRHLRYKITWLDLLVIIRTCYT